eukprot:scaffold649295_cov45-Prasinocladus_malaysianus.AAC.1
MHQRLYLVQRDAGGCCASTSSALCPKPSSKGAAEGTAGVHGALQKACDPGWALLRPGEE